MTLSLSLISTERRLARPVLNARQSWSTRAACLVALESHDGVRGVGEASPLPGFSQDTLSECHAALAALDTRTLSASPEPGQPIVEQLGRISSQLPSGVPAARAALEAAMLDLWSRAAKVPAWALLLGKEATPKPRALSALLDDPEQALSDALRAEARGLGTFKFKIGRPGLLERELAVLGQLRQHLGKGARLRLDANQSFTAQQAQHNLARFAELGVELVEEPCAFTELNLSTALVPLALDESLSLLALESEPSRTAKVRGARALILKPTVLGGISACYAWAQVAASVGAEVILSHTFEGPAGLAVCAALALSIGSETFAHGLDVEGARLQWQNLRCFSGTHVQEWSELGLGVEPTEP